MITRQQLEDAIGEDSDKSPFKNKNIDHDLTLINLLRERVPFSVENEIIAGAEHDEIFLIEIDVALKYLNEEDLLVLIECNTLIDTEGDCLALYV